MLKYIKINRNHLSVSYQKGVNRRQLDRTSLSPIVVVGLGEKELSFHCKPNNKHNKVSFCQETRDRNVKSHDDVNYNRITELNGSFAIALGFSFT